jgi:hypothetical protein
MTIQSRCLISADAGTHTETTGFAQCMRQVPARSGTSLEELDWRSATPREFSTTLREPRRRHDEAAWGNLTAGQ